MAEAKEATELAQDSAQKVQAYLQLDEEMNIERISKKSLEKSRKIEEQSTELFDKRGIRILRLESLFTHFRFSFQKWTFVMTWSRREIACEISQR